MRLSRDSSRRKAEGSPEVVEASEVSRKVEKRNGADLFGRRVKKKKGERRSNGF